MAINEAPDSPSTSAMYFTLSEGNQLRTFLASDSSSEKTQIEFAE
jgi:hypothetical protein